MPEKPSQWTIWKTAIRPHTLTASLSPCLVAYATTRPPIHLQLAWTLFCISVQIGTNLHNDYSDFVKGADTDKRVGHARATAKGWLTPQETCMASVAALSVTFASGVYLLWATEQLENGIAWFVVLTSVLNAFAYTGGPFPLGYIGLGHVSIAYSGLGEVFVMLYFGYAAVLMLPWLLYSRGLPVDWVSQAINSTCVGLLATNIIIVNNLRDRHTDGDAGKRTTAVRFGRSFALVEYTLCNVLSYALLFMKTISSGSAWSLLPILTLPLAIRETIAVFGKEGAALNPHVGGAAIVEFLFCVLLSLVLR